MRKTAPQLSFKKVNGWGGKRRGAGRPNRSGQVGHGERPAVSKRVPMHLTWKLKADLVNLRCGEIESVFKTCSEAVKKFGLRIVHYSIQRDHLHMFAEADGAEALALGMRSFGCRFGKAIRKIAGGRGPVFAGRYHLQLLETPTQVRNTLAYVLQNQAKHTKLIKHLDRYSSAPYFGQWKILFKGKMGPVLGSASRPPPLPQFLSPPKTWLAREGWQRARDVNDG
jgi:hypothetical protein